MTPFPVYWEPAALLRELSLPLLSLNEDRGTADEPLACELDADVGCLLLREAFIRAVAALAGAVTSSTESKVGLELLIRLVEPDCVRDHCNDPSTS